MKGLRIGEQVSWLKEQLRRSMRDNKEFSDIQQFYELLAQIESKIGGKRILANCDGECHGQNVVFISSLNQEKSAQQQEVA